YSILQTNTQKVQLTNQKRREIVRAITEGRMTVKQAMLACNITCASSIRKWIREMQDETVDLADNNRLSMPPLPVPDHQKELAAAKLKITALETMIDIAEEQFKISIRKKYGAKRYHSLFDNATHHIDVIRSLAKKGKGLSRSEIIKACKLTSGGRHHPVTGRAYRIRIYHPLYPFRPDCKGQYL